VVTRRTATTSGPAISARVRAAAASAAGGGLRKAQTTSRRSLLPNNICEVFDEIWRVLRDDGTCWIVIGDSYSSGGRTSYGSDKKYPARHMVECRPAMPGIKPKNLLLIPARVALALQDRGWIVRRRGWMAGVGLEFGLFDNWSAKIEYDYLGFGSRDVTLNGSATASCVGPCRLPEIEVGADPTKTFAFSRRSSTKPYRPPMTTSTTHYSGGDSPMNLSSSRF
jgi:hypothetical protein